MSVFDSKHVHGPHADGSFTVKGWPGAAWTISRTGEDWGAFHPDGVVARRWNTAEAAISHVLDMAGLT